MDNYIIPFKQLHIKKISVCFTWDDNFVRHAECIAPLFEQYGKRCSFYINVGDEDFSQKMASGYCALNKKGFEIGSHGYNHKHMDRIPKDEFIKQMQLSLAYMLKAWKHRPTTFAFPHHDYNEEMLILAKAFFLETRNTLVNAKRISLKSNTTLTDIICNIDSIINDNLNIIFSGHSTKIPQDEKSDYTDGYEPISISVIDDILKYLISLNHKTEVITFEQAALKEYIKEHCNYTNSQCEITSQTLTKFLDFGLDINKISSLI